MPTKQRAKQKEFLLIARDNKSEGFAYATPKNTGLLESKI